MFASGHSRRFGRSGSMSLLPRQRPCRLSAATVAKGRKRTHAPLQIISLFDHLVGGGKQRLRNAQAEGFGGLWVDDEIEFGRLLYGQVGRLIAFENLAHIDADLAQRVRETDVVAHDYKFAFRESPPAFPFLPTRFSTAEFSADDLRRHAGPCSQVNAAQGQSQQRSLRNV